MSVKGKSILVTGGAGFIGSNLVSTLLSMGNEVTVIDDFSRGKHENLDAGNNNLEITLGDVRDYDLVKAAAENADYVIHTAASPQSFCVAQPRVDLEVNALGTLNVLLAVLDSDADRIIYTSSSSIYGSAKTINQQENDQVDPSSPYAVSKLAGENYCRMFSQVYGLKTTILRYFNVYGPKKSTDGGYGVVPLFFGRALKDQSPLIHGDGKQTRDFTFIADAVEATMLILRSVTSDFDIFNVGTGVETSVNELALKIIDVCGKAGKLKPRHIRPTLSTEVGNVRRRCANIGKINQIVGWKPRYSIDQGLKATRERLGEAMTRESSTN